MWRDINVGLTDSRLVVQARSQRGFSLSLQLGEKTTAILFFFCSFFELKSKKVFYVFHHGGKKSYLLLFFCQTGGEHALISPLFTSCAIFFGDTRFIFIFSLWKRAPIEFKGKTLWRLHKRSRLDPSPAFQLGAKTKRHKRFITKWNIHTSTERMKKRTKILYSKPQQELHHQFRVH